MDPLSITVSVASLLGVCIKVGSALSKFVDESQIVDSRVRGLIVEVGSFTQTLSSMKDTLEDKQIQNAFKLTGHIGNHWRCISGCIDNGLKTLKNLQLTLEGVDKSVRVFDSIRKQLRYKDATEEISVYQQQIRAYRDTIQLSLQTAILWNQVSMRDATSDTVPRLDELSVVIRRLGKQMNQRLAALENMVESPSKQEEVRSIRTMRGCLHTSADLVSSASTALGMSDTASVIAPSDYMDIFPTPRNELMQQWILEVAPAPQFAVRSQSYGSASGAVCIEESDSEAEFEAEILRVQLFQGREELQHGNTATAERVLNTGISRLRRHKSRYLNAEQKLVMLQGLLETYQQQSKWDQVKKIRMERISILSEDNSTELARYLGETLELVELLLKMGNQREARIYARKCAIAYRKLGSNGREGLRRALTLMITACSLDGDEADELTYKAMLRNLLGECQDFSDSDSKVVDVSFKEIDTISTTSDGPPEVRTQKEQAVPYSVTEEFQLPAQSFEQQPVLTIISQPCLGLNTSTHTKDDVCLFESVSLSSSHVQEIHVPSSTVHTLQEKVSNTVENGGSELAKEQSYPILSDPQDRQALADKAPLALSSLINTGRGHAEEADGWHEVIRFDTNFANITTLADSLFNPPIETVVIDNQPEPIPEIRTIPAICIQSATITGNNDDALTLVDVANETDGVMLSESRPAKATHSHEMWQFVPPIRPSAPPPPDTPLALNASDYFTSSSRPQSGGSGTASKISRGHSPSPFITAYCYNGSRSILLRCTIFKDTYSLVSRKWLSVAYPREAGSEEVMLRYTVVSTNGSKPRSFQTSFLVVDEEDFGYDAVLGGEVDIAEDIKLLDSHEKGPERLLRQNKGHYASKSDSHLPIQRHSGEQRLPVEPERIRLNPDPEILSQPHRSASSSKVVLRNEDRSYFLGPTELTRSVSVNDQPIRERRDAAIDAMPRVTSVIIGPNCCGKTSLIHRYLHKDDAPPAPNNSLNVYTTVTNGPKIEDGVHMVIWDTPGDIRELRKMDAVQNVNCIVLCFTVDSPQSISDIDRLWIPEIKKVYPGRPIILAALRVDLRKSADTLRMLAHLDDQPCSSAEGKRIMDRIGAVRYFDCSTKTKEGINDLFYEVALLGLQSKMEVRRTKSFWRFSRRSLRGR